MRVGLITYHAAYNFGSVLQTYATQEILRQCGYDVSIINYRPISQRNFYKLIPKGTGFKRLIKFFLTVPIIDKRIQREKKYEESFQNLYSVTEELREPYEMEGIKDDYDVYVSGSDQIWNKNSNELKYVNWRKYMGPYLLDFTDRKKISYASSINDMTDEDLLKIKSAISRFDHISMREESSAKRIEKMLDRNIETVLDPTLLLDKDSWSALIGKRKNTFCGSKYILYYSLSSYKKVLRELYYLKHMKEIEDLKIVVLTPLGIPALGRRFINVSDADIYDFLGLIKDAEYVVTASYHGTLFSIIFNKQFYSIQRSQGSNLRVEEIAKKLGIEDRIIYLLEDIDFKRTLDYNEINKKKNILRTKSLDYLKTAIDY